MKTHDRLGIISLVLAVAAVLSGIVFFVSGLYIFMPGVLFLLALCIVLSIISMREPHLKRKAVPITALVVSVIGFLAVLYPVIFFARLFMAMQPQKVYSFEVPLRISISTGNLDYSMLPDADKIDMFIFAEDDKSIPQNCMPDYFMFGGVRSLVLLNPEPYSMEYRGGIGEFPLECAGTPGCSLRYTKKIGSPITKTYLLKLDEDENKPGASKRLLESGNDKFYVRYSLVPAMGDPDLIRNMSATGCFFSYDTIGGMAMKERTIEISQLQNKEQGRESIVVCVKQFHGYHDYAGKYSKNYCTFFEVSYDLGIEYEIELAKGEQTYEIVYPHI